MIKRIFQSFLPQQAKGVTPSYFTFQNSGFFTINKQSNSLITNLSEKIQYNRSFDIRNRSKEVLFKKWKIVRGDKVIMNSGKDKGKTGLVVRVYRKQNKVLVSGINIKFKRQKISGEDGESAVGSVKKKTHPVHVSNVSLIDPETQKACRIHFGYLADGKKVRISKKTGSIIEKPNNPSWQVKIRNKNKIDGIKDTPADIVTEITYQGENFDKIKAEFEEFIKDKEKREKLLVFDE